ncbi:MAG: pyrroline-5-carboxylate reductase [Planctomycetes bacterium]|nr:pyrroline-5-carboxylate reductase [Planctomycetota bacterium]
MAPPDPRSQARTHANLDEPAKSLSDSTWCLVGGGNMASAIVHGSIDAGVMAADRFVIVEADAEKRDGWTREGVANFGGVREGLAHLASIERHPGDGHIVLAVKPQMYGAVAPGLCEELKRIPRRVCSIMAGVTTARIEESLGAGAHVVRVMPNTPAQIRMGTAAFARGVSMPLGEETQVVALFATLGKVVALREELFDAFTAIAGSGPAYLFALAEAMVAGAIKQGIEPTDADAIVRSVLEGSASLLARHAHLAPGSHRAAVTSRGGTTAAALQIWEERGVMQSIAEAIDAAAARGRELSRQI